jgi:hypothetical protein
VSALRAHGLDAVVADERAVGRAGGVVAVVPVGLDEVVTEPRELWLRVERLAAADDAVRPAWVVVLWAVRHGERAAFATAYDGASELAGDRRRAGRNAVLLVTGDGWRRELAQHGRDPADAASCRSAQVRRLLVADSHQRVAGASGRTVCADLTALDPDVLHGVLVELPGHGWTGWTAAAATVAVARTGGETR